MVIIHSLELFHCFKRSPIIGILSEIHGYVRFQRVILTIHTVYRVEIIHVVFTTQCCDYIHQLCDEYPPTARLHAYSTVRLPVVGIQIQILLTCHMRSAVERQRFIERQPAATRRSRKILRTERRYLPSAVYCLIIPKLKS